VTVWAQLEHLKVQPAAMRLRESRCDRAPEFNCVRS
jgi:hypothetical protein